MVVSVILVIYFKSKFTNIDVKEELSKIKKQMEKYKLLVGFTAQ